MAKIWGRSGALVAINQVITEGCVLLRNILLARLMGAEEMGLAVMLAIVLRSIEMISYVAADRLLVQAKDGNTPQFQANAHGLEVMRGILSGVVLGLLAYPTALAFGFPEMAVAFAALGIVPVIRGFAHLDFRRYQRHLRFAATLKVESAAALIGTIAVWPAWVWTGDFTALLWVNIVQGLAFLVFSHLAGQRTYRIQLDRAYLKRLLKFGWPLLVNSLVMFGVFQGDRIIVAMAVSPAELGRYALALQLGLLPTLVFARASLSLVLPVLSRVQHSREEFASQYRNILPMLAAAAVCFVLGYTLFGNAAMRILFGQEFVVDALVLSWLGAALALRILRIGSGTALLSLGDSRGLMQTNLWRILGVILAGAFALKGLGLAFIAAAAAAGELVALVAGIRILERKHDVATPLYTIAIPLAAIALITSSFSIVLREPVAWIALGMTGLVVVAGFFLRNRVRSGHSLLRETS